MNDAPACNGASGVVERVRVVSARVLLGDVALVHVLEHLLLRRSDGGPKPPSPAASGRRTRSLRQARVRVALLRVTLPSGAAAHRRSGVLRCLLRAPRARSCALGSLRGSGRPCQVRGLSVTSGDPRSGPGRNRGGLGPDMAFHFLEDAFAISTIERTKNAPWGLEGGGEGRPNAGELRLPDGSVTPVAKATGLALPKGSVFVFHCGGRRPRPAVRTPEGEGARGPARGLHHRGARAHSLPARVRRRLMHRCAVDVGGTFIDFVLLDEESGALVVEKQPARRETLVDEFLAGLERLPVSPSELDLLFHGTTVGINTVLQQRGARVGLVTTAGFATSSRSAAGRDPSCTTSSIALRRRSCRGTSGARCRSGCRRRVGARAARPGGA